MKIQPSFFLEGTQHGFFQQPSHETHGPAHKAAFNALTQGKMGRNSQGIYSKDGNSSTDGFEARPVYPNSKGAGWDCHLVLARALVSKPKLSFTPIHTPVTLSPKIKLKEPDHAIVFV